MLVVYAYIPTPTQDRLREFVRQLGQCGLTISHLGKKDPPQRWAGTAEEAVEIITGKGNGTDYTFLDAEGCSLGITIELRHDPRWGYSTVSFSCPEREHLDSASRIVLNTLSPYLCICGTTGSGKNQAWNVLHQSADCPQSLRRLTQA